MIKINSKELTKKLKEVAKFSFQKQLNILAIDTISIINDRVEKGVDLKGKAFDKYSTSYAKKKKKSGRNIKPNLQFTGEMLNSITHNVEKNTVVISFPERNHKKSNTSIKEIAEANDKQRSFFDLTQKEFDNAVEKNVFKPLEKLLDA